MTQKLREIVTSRRDIPSSVAASLIPLEQSSHDQAIGTSALKTLLLTSHSAVALPIEAGAEVLRLVNEAAHHAEQHRAKLGEVHTALKSIATDILGSGAYCPPNAHELAPLRSIG